jgi:hypothetical protein
MTNLERLVSAHQLIPYPADDRRFNQTYNLAASALALNPSLKELYIIQYKDHEGGLHFSFVSAHLISRDRENGPYFLTDICAVLRR